MRETFDALSSLGEPTKLRNSDLGGGRGVGGLGAGQACCFPTIQTAEPSPGDCDPETAETAGFHFAFIRVCLSAQPCWQLC